MNYGYTKKVEISYEKAVLKTKEALARKGFGILTEIDVKTTLKKKLGVDFDKYIILGACNPPFAHKALITEREIGLLLPCNVIVYEQQGDVFVSAIVPSIAMGMIENETLRDIANEVEEKLKKVIDVVAQ